MPALARLRARIERAQQGLASVGERQLTAAIAHAPGVRAASVQARRDALHLDLTFDDGATWTGLVIPGAIRFAPRGAKEVGFHVQPDEVAGDPHLRDVIAVLAGVVARTLWAMLVPPRAPIGLAGSVARDGSTYRVDLRSVPEIRRIATSGVLANAVDLLELREIICEDGELRLRIGLPAGILP